MTLDSSPREMLRHVEQLYSILYVLLERTCILPGFDVGGLIRARRDGDYSTIDAFWYSGMTIRDDPASAKLARAM
jgi:hypothetical protein